MLRIAIVGAGKAGSALLDILCKSKEVDVVGIADINSDAMGLEIAGKRGIYTADNLPALRDRSPQIVFNATGINELGDSIRENFSYPVEVMGGDATHVLWNIVNEYRRSQDDTVSLYNNSLKITKADNLNGALEELLTDSIDLIDASAGSIEFRADDDIILFKEKGKPACFVQDPCCIENSRKLLPQIERSAPKVLTADENRELFKKINFFEDEIKSIIVTPLINKNKSAGLIYLYDFKERRYTDRDKDLLNLFSTIAVQLIEKFKLLEKCEKSLAYLQSVLNDSQDMIITSDNDRRIVEFSKGGERILGYSKQELIGKEVIEIYADKSERESLLKELKEKGYLHNYETVLLNKNGTPVDISLTLSELRDKSGKIIGTVGVSKNITTEKKLRKQLEKKNRELKELNEELEEKVRNRTRALEISNTELSKASEMKSRFIANASHELRTPLNSIIGFSEILMDKSFGALNEKQEHYLNNINTSGKHLLHLVNSILDLAKIEAGKAEVVYENFGARETVNEILAVLRSLSDGKRIKIVNDIPADISIRADKVKFKQIFYNLLSNAIKFTPKNGEVGMRSEMLDDNITIPWAPTNQDFIKLTVWDSGIGIKPDDREKVFEEFQQIDGSKATEGTGLGLSLTKKLVEIHAGHIEIEDSARKGTVFNVYLPIVHFEPKAKNKESRDELPLFPMPDINDGPLVLVAEDDMPTSEILTIYLTQAGYRVAHAYNGEEAIEKARKEKPFVIALDIMLPKKDGWEVLQALKEDTETSDIPVIIHSIVENRELAFALGATDYLVKPASKEILINKIKTVPLLPNKIRRPLSILAITDDSCVIETLHTILDEERDKYLLHFAADPREGLDMAVITTPDLIIIDSEISDGGCNLISRVKNNPTLKDIPIFAFAGRGESPDEKEKMMSQIEAILTKDALNSNQLLQHLNNLQIIYPRKAGLIDQTTGLFNEKYFFIRLSQEVSRAKRYTMPFVLILISMDNFDHYKNLKGEYYANLVMRKTADLVKKNLRASDILMRYSHGSFAVILTNTSIKPALGMGKRFVSLIYEYPYLEEEVQPMGKITSSMGLGEYCGRSTEEMLGNVQEAVSRAFDRGGNRIEYDKT